jgi:hypothetical protein
MPLLKLRGRCSLHRIAASTVILRVLAVAGALALAACGEAPEPVSEQARAPQRVEVTVEELKPQTWQSTVSTFGVVEALEEVNVARNGHRCSGAHQRGRRADPRRSKERSNPAVFAASGGQGGGAAARSCWRKALSSAVTPVMEVHVTAASRSSPEVRILLGKTGALGVSIGAIRARNLRAPSLKKIAVGQFRDPREVETVVVRSGARNTVLLRDIATRTGR